MRNRLHIDSDSSVSTLSLLRNMGAEAFVYFYQPLKAHKDLDTFTLASYCPKNFCWTDESKRTKVCTAKRIFKEGRAREALELVLGMNVSSDIRNMASRYLEELSNRELELE
jgi:hypothetical protein